MKKKVEKKEKFTKSKRKYIRKEKAQIRREFLGKEEQKKKIEEFLNSLRVKKPKK